MPETELLRHVRALSGRIREQDDAVRLAGNAEVIGQRAATLTACVDAATQSIILTDVFREQGLTVSWDRTALQSLRNRLSRFAGRVNNDPDAILDPKPELWPILDGFPDEASLRLLGSWRAWIDAAVPTVDSGTMSTLGKLDEFNDAVRDIQGKLSRRNELRSHLPDGAADFDAVRELAAEVTDLRSSLVGSGLPGGVSAFLEAASRGDATLAQLTDEVRGWLEEKHLSGMVRLSIRSRGSGAA
jgi:hypothetical protein